MGVTKYTMCVSVCVFACNIQFVSYASFHQGNNYRIKESLWFKLVQKKPIEYWKRNIAAQFPVKCPHVSLPPTQTKTNMALDSETWIFFLRNKNLEDFLDTWFFQHQWSNLLTIPRTIIFSSWTIFVLALCKQPLQTCRSYSSVRQHKRGVKLRWGFQSYVTTEDLLNADCSWLNFFCSRVLGSVHPVHVSAFFIQLCPLASLTGPLQHLNDPNGLLLTHVLGHRKLYTPYVDKRLADLL